MSSLSISSRTVERLTLVYVLVLTVLSTVKLSPYVPMADVVGIDKVVHLILYLGLNMLLLTVCAVRAFTSTRLMPMIWVTLVAIAYGCVMEVVQHFIGRQCSLLDIAANSLGALLALLIFRRPVISRLVRSIVT